MERLNLMDWLTSIVAAIGGAQMAMVGFFNYDLISKLFGDSVLYRSIIGVLALAILYLVGDVWVHVTSYQNQHSHA